MRNWRFLGHSSASCVDGGFSMVWVQHYTVFKIISKFSSTKKVLGLNFLFMLTQQFLTSIPKPQKCNYVSRSGDEKGIVFVMCFFSQGTMIHLFQTGVDWHKRDCQSASLDPPVIAHSHKLAGIPKQFHIMAQTGPNLPSFQDHTRSVVHKTVSWWIFKYPWLYWTDWGDNISLPILKTPSLRLKSESMASKHYF